jgi:hypothetical protein
MPPERTRIDKWWGEIQDGGKYPALCKLALAMCSIFHGPMVESSFNTMGDIINVKSANMNIDTYSCIQTVKYFLKARNLSAVQCFSKQDIFDPVDHALYLNFKHASAEYRNQLKAKGAAVKVKDRQLNVVNRNKNESKKQAKTNSQNQAFLDRVKHAQKEARKARIGLLEALAKKRKG